jgi:DNA-binding transcriptional regulator YiaG
MTLAPTKTRTEGDVGKLVDRLRSTRLPPCSDWRAIRLAAGASLRDVAAAVGVDAMTISRWELGRSKPWPRHALAYRRVLDALAEVTRELQAEQTQK